MDGPTDIEYLQNATLEYLEHLTVQLTDQRFWFDYIQTLNAEDKVDALIITHRSRQMSS